VERRGGVRGEPNDPNKRQAEMLDLNRWRGGRERESRSIARHSAIARAMACGHGVFIQYTAWLHDREASSLAVSCCQFESKLWLGLALPAEAFGVAIDESSESKRFYVLSLSKLPSDSFSRSHTPSCPLRPFRHHGATTHRYTDTEYCAEKSSDREGRRKLRGTVEAHAKVGRAEP
jgi:hypothetical protein